MLLSVSDMEVPTGTPLPCSVLILRMAKNQSDIENLVKNLSNIIFTTAIFALCAAKSSVLRESFNRDLEKNVCYKEVSTQNCLLYKG